MAAAHQLAASDSAVELPAPNIGQSAAASAAAIPAAPEQFVPAPLPEVAAAVPPAGENVPPVACQPATASHAFAVYSTSFADSVPAPSTEDAGADREQCEEHRAGAGQLMAADLSANPDPIEMSACDNGMPVRSVISSDHAIEARVLRQTISPTEISSTATVTDPECVVTPNTAERFLPVSDVAVTAVHPSHSGNVRRLVQPLAAQDDPNECAEAHASCCIPQRVRHYATLDVAPVPVSLMDTSVPPGPPAMKATVRYEPSDRYFSAAAIDFAVTDSADEAVAEVKSVNDLTLASHLSAVDHELALYEYGPAAAAVVDPIHSEHADDDRCTVVQPSKRFRPDVQRFAPALRDHADAGMTESMAVDAAVVEPIPNEHADFSDPRFKRSTVTVKVVHERNSNPTDDVTIDGGVKSTNVTVFAADPDPTVRNAVRDSRHAAPCHLQSGFDMLATAPSVRACFATGLECPNMPSGVLLDARFSVSLTV